MWNVIAPFVRWPLHSPLRLFLIGMTALVLVFVAGEINGDDTAPAATPAAEASATSSAEPSWSTVRSSEAAVTPTAAASPAPDGTAGAAAGVSGEDETDAFHDDPAKTNPSAAAGDAAAEFVASWARPDRTVQDWSAEVQPLVTDGLWSDGLANTDPANTPAVTVRGEPRLVALNNEEGVFDVPTTGPWVRVHVQYDSADARWLVSNVEPAE